MTRTYKNTKTKEVRTMTTDELREADRPLFEALDRCGDHIASRRYAIERHGMWIVFHPHFSYEINPLCVVRVFNRTTPRGPRRFEYQWKGDDPVEISAATAATLLRSGTDHYRSIAA